MIDVVRWGIIGCGNVVEFKSGPPLYQTPGSELVAVMRRDAAKAADFAQRHGARRWYTQAEALIADADVNAIYIASPHYQHAAHVKLAANAGKIVLCEKPMGISVAEAQACVDVCRANNVPLAVAYYRREWPIVQKMRELLNDGAIGRVVSARIHLADYFAGDPERPWLTSKALAGGGALANAGSHWIDLVRYLLGDVISVNAQCSAHASGFETEDTIVMQMETISQALVSVSITLQSPINANEFEISGTQGRLRATSLADGQLIIDRAGEKTQALSLARSRFAHAEFIAVLIDRLRSGQPSPIPGEEAVAVWRIMDAAYRACETGVRQRINA
ncbi:MAG: Gfo/Idh/MocA family oxidoreductase [Chloroflexi bacterium]|nr:Gfo/Idh/MocA family oxidoreductase [Chloroflexota bacterium]